MTHVTRSALVPYAPARMFDLVNDIPRYPEFLPWCRASEVLDDSGTEMTARIHVSWGGIKRSFTTRNRLTPGESIDLSLVEGPFSHLRGRWRFSPLGDAGEACKVELELDFDFSTAFVSAAFAPVFTHIADTMVDSFTRRAVDVYGTA